MGFCSYTFKREGKRAARFYVGQAVFSIGMQSKKKMGQNDLVDTNPPRQRIGNTSDIIGTNRAAEAYAGTPSSLNRIPATVDPVVVMAHPHALLPPK